MADNKNVLDKILMDVQVTKEDLVAIGVAQHEEQLKMKEAEAKKNLRVLKEKIAEIEKRFNAACFKAVHDKVREDLEEANEALVKLGFTETKIELSVSPSAPDEEIHYLLSLGRGYGGRTARGTVLMKKGVKKIYIELEAVKEEHVRLQEYTMEVKKHLANLGTHERRARAALAMRTIGQMEGGAELMDAMRDVKALPLPEL